MIYLRRFNESIETLEDKWNYISDRLYREGVSIKINLAKKDNKLSIILMDIKSSISGMGTKGMLELLKFADENKLNIWLLTSSNYGSDMDRLVEFYERFGFTKVNKHYSGGYEMVRQPI